VEPPGNNPLFAGICLWIQVRKKVQLPAEFRWAQGFLGQSPLADTAGQGDRHDGCRSAAGIWVVPWEDTAAAVCTVGSPHGPEGRVGNGLNKADQVQELMEEVGQSETWTEWNSKLLK